MSQELFSSEDVFFMEEALEQAKLAKSLGEVPIGAVVVFDGQIIAKACNRTIIDNDPTAHAEMLAIQIAAKYLNNHRLVNTKLYVTLEPCIMCLGALIQARVSDVYFSSFDSRVGTISVDRLHENKKLNHEISFNGGLLSLESGILLRNFFKKKR
jgi:tRNA(Arg) A34 adenosine deaminase TadA